MTANNKKLKKYLELFELEQNYSIDDLKTARKDLLHAWHPDKHSHSERAIEKAKNKTFEINKGYDYLKDLLEKGYVDEALTDQNENEIDNDFDEWVDEKIDEVIKKNTSSFSNSDYWLQAEAVAILIFLGFFFFTSIIISNLLLHNFSIFIIILGIIGVPFGIFLFLAVSEHTIFFDWLNRHFEKIGLKGFFIISIFITSIMVFYVKPVVENYLKKQTRIEQQKQQARITRQNRAANFKKELDSKNGFQDFHFGMTTAQIIEIKKPSRELSDKENKSKTFIYERNMMLFKYPLEFVTLEFFDDKLHRIDIRFSSNPNKIYNAFKSKYGIPFKNDNWTRGEKPLIGKMWDGNTVSCIILAENTDTTKGVIFDDLEPIWDAIVIYHKSWNSLSKSFKKDRPLREAKNASENL